MPIWYSFPPLVCFCRSCHWSSALPPLPSCGFPGTLFFSPSFFGDSRRFPIPRPPSLLWYLQIPLLHCLEYFQGQTGFLSTLQNLKEPGWQERTSDDGHVAREREKEERRRAQGRDAKGSWCCAPGPATCRAFFKWHVMGPSKLSHTRWKSQGSQRLIWLNVFLLVRAGVDITISLGSKHF